MERLKYQDSSLPPKERAADLLERMTFEEKIDQLGCVYIKGTEVPDMDEMIRCGVGNVGMTLTLDTAREFYELNRTIQKLVMEKSRFHIPALIHNEALSGALFAQATSFPTSLVQASTWNPSLVKKMAEGIRKEMTEVGFRQALSPVFDISRDSRWGRMMETYGEDETLASAFSVAFVEGIQGDGPKKEIAATGKHFIGHGIPENGLNQAQNIVSERDIKEVHGKPFQAAISKAGLLSVMNSYGAVNREAVIGSRKILTELLRDEMGFDGLLVSDYYSINRLVKPYNVAETPLEAGIKALEAGLDVEYPHPYGYTYELKQAVEDGRLSEKTVDRSVQRILELKFALGLFENPFAGDTFHEEVFTQHRGEAVNRQIAAQSMVLLKNSENLLPLDKNIKKIAVIGPHADRVRAAFGAYTYASMIDMLEDNLNNNKQPRQNTGEIMAAVYQRFPGDLRETPVYVEEKIRKLYPRTKTLYEAIKDYLPDSEVVYSQGISYTGNNIGGYRQTLEMAADADVVILTLGGQSGWGATATNGEGVDNSNIDLPGMQEQFAKDVYKLHRKTVVVHMDGRPLCNAFVTSRFDAIIEAWQVGEFGFEELTKIIFGETNPSGRLPVTIPKSVEQLPVYYSQLKGSGYGNMGCENTYSCNFGYINRDTLPRYCFGYGLSYTDFAYEELYLNQEKVMPQDTLVVRVKVKNTGKRAGEEVVQLYISDDVSSIVRPRKILAGFGRISLQPKEEKILQFDLHMNQLAFLDEDMRWKVEAGKMHLLIGASAEDIRLTRRFEILEDLYIDGTKREFYALGHEVKEED